MSETSRTDVQRDLLELTKLIEILGSQLESNDFPNLANIHQAIQQTKASLAFAINLTETQPNNAAFPPDLFITPEGYTAYPASTVAARTGLSYHRLYELVADGRIRATKVGRHHVVSLEDAEHYVSSPRNKGGRPRASRTKPADTTSGLTTLPSPITTSEGWTGYPLVAVAAYLAQSPVYLSKLARRRKIHATKVGRNYVVDLKEVRRYLTAPKNKGGRPRKNG